MNWVLKYIEMQTDKDHVHLLISCDPQFGIHRVVKGLKGFSARVLRRENFPHLKSTMPSMWTNSYFCATVGSVSLETVKEYIENQQFGTKKEMIKTNRIKLKLNKPQFDLVREKNKLNVQIVGMI